MLHRDDPVPSAWGRVRGAVQRAGGELVRKAWDGAVEWGAIGPRTKIGRRFGRFGHHSVICFPPAVIFNEYAIHVGEGTMIGPYVSLSAGMIPGQQMVSNPVVTIGDRCLIGRGSSIVGHWSIVIGDDVWTGPNVYITDQNHGYEDLTVPISQQSMPERPVSIGDGSWLGTGCIVLPGATIGRHVVVAAGSVVNGHLPDRTVCAGSPARVLRQWDPVEGWHRPAGQHPAAPG